MDREKKKILEARYPLPIDETLLGMIECGDEELTDALFFELIKETPAYLSRVPFQKRIAEWQEQLSSPVFETTERKAAKLNLRKIGQVLAIQRQGRPEKFNEAAIAAAYWLCKKEIGQFLDKNRNLSAAARIKEFRKCFPRWADNVQLSRHRSAQEIAIFLISKQYLISERLLRGIIKTFPT